MLRTLLDTLTKNNTGFIVGLSTLIIFILIYLIARSFQERDSDSQPIVTLKSDKPKKANKKEAAKAGETAPGGSVDDSPLDDLDNLDDLMGPNDTSLAATAGIPTPDDPLEAAFLATDTAPSSAAAAAPAGVSPEQKVELSQALSEKEKVITDLKTEISTLQEKMKSIPDTGAMETKIKDLQDKLSEYEIIEDDIANLSFYKAENAKLKDELAKLQGIEIPQAAASAPAEPPPAMPDLNPPPVQKEAPDMSGSSKVMDEFQEAVQQKEKLEQNVGTAPSAAPLVPPSEADIMKEFENVVQKELGGEAPQSAAPAAPAAPAAAPVEEKNSAVDEIDSQKLMSEMESLAQAPAPEEKEDDKDSSQKLIEEFENFVNKM